MRFCVGHVAARFGALGSIALLAACTSLAMPTSGPESWDIKSEQNLDVDGLKFALVRVNPDIVNEMARISPEGLAGAFTDRKPVPRQTFQIGDVLSVTIFEASAGGLFIPSEAGVRPGNFVALPDQSVDSAGNISVPYAGTVRAKGRTTDEVQNDIVAKLRNRAIEPQVVVALKTQNGGLVSVLGEVNLPSRFATTADGDKMVDAITRAGGIKGQGWDVSVMLERGGRRQTVPFVNLVDYPANNIYIQPRDNIYVFRQPQTFLAFGATGQQGQFEFGDWRITLAEAVAKAGGLLDAQGDPAAVFLYRAETREVAAKLGVDVSKYSTNRIPVIYNANLRDPSGFFLATQVRMRNKDILYISNAQSVEIVKVLQYMRVAMATVNDGIGIANNSVVLRNNLRR
jgi:polysaccharide export outer membrane protein